MAKLPPKLHLLNRVLGLTTGAAMRTFAAQAFYASVSVDEPKLLRRLRIVLRAILIELDTENYGADLFDESDDEGDFKDAGPGSPSSPMSPDGGGGGCDGGVPSNRPGREGMPGERPSAAALLAGGGGSAPQGGSVLRSVHFGGEVEALLVAFGEGSGRLGVGFDPNRPESLVVVKCDPESQVRGKKGTPRPQLPAAAAAAAAAASNIISDPTKASPPAERPSSVPTSPTATN
jgi:hypothetical protein